ncbi:MAG TPA: hypothetical protein VGC92_08140, partial [Phenylobacterium sp.]
TLFHEVAFYAMFSLLILNRWGGVIALGAWALICAATYHYTGESGFTAAQVYSSAYNLEFFGGMAAYGLYRRGRNPRLLLGVGLAVLVTAWIVATWWDRLDHGVFGLGFALAIAGATILETEGRLKTPEPLVAIGGASYSLYLIHVPVSGVVLKLIMLAHLRGIVPAAVLWWVVFLLTVGVGYVAWVLLERPMQLRLRFRRSAAVSPAT